MKNIVQAVKNPFFRFPFFLGVLFSLGEFFQEENLTKEANEVNIFFKKIDALLNLFRICKVEINDKVIVDAINIIGVPSCLGIFYEEELDDNHFSADLSGFYKGAKVDFPTVLQ